MGADLGNAVKSIPAYVEKSDFVVVVAPGCLHADRRDPETKLRTKTCYHVSLRSWWLRGLGVTDSRMSSHEDFKTYLRWTKADRTYFDESGVPMS